MKSFGCISMMILLILTGCASGIEPASPVITESPPTLLAITTSTPMATYTTFPTAERMPSATPYPTIAPLSLPTINPTATRTASSGGNQGQSNGDLNGAPTQISSGPDLTPILIVIDSGATCRGSSQIKEALFQLGVVNRGNIPVSEAYNITWSLGWDDFKGVERTTLVTYQEWGLQWTVWLENKYFWVPCETTTTFTAYINADTGNTISELNEGNNSASQTYTITYVP